MVKSISRIHLSHSNRSGVESGEYYYLGVVTPALHYCMGGVSIDSSGRVMKAGGRFLKVYMLLVK